MDHEKAVEIGAPRSMVAAERLEEATGFPTHTVCVVKRLDGSGTSGGAHIWTPVGEENLTEVEVFEQKEPSGDGLVLLVDRDGVAKATVRDLMPFGEAVRVAKSLLFAVSRAKESRLRQALEAEDLTEQVRCSTLRIDL